MQHATWDALVDEFNLIPVPPRYLNSAERYMLEVFPMVGLLDVPASALAGIGAEHADFFRPRGVVTGDLFIGWATPAEAVFTLGHECGHMVMGHNSLVTGRLTRNEIEADRWGILALVAKGFDPHIGPAFLGRMVLEWTRPEDSTHPAVCELYERILAMEAFIQDNVTDLAVAS
jgi:hypothetical protein